MSDDYEPSLGECHSPPAARLRAEIERAEVKRWRDNIDQATKRAGEGPHVQKRTAELTAEVERLRQELDARTAHHERLTIERNQEGTMSEPKRRRPCRECPWTRKHASQQKAQRALDACPTVFYCHKDDPATNGRPLTLCHSLYSRDDLQPPTRGDDVQLRPLVHPDCQKNSHRPMTNLHDYIEQNRLIRHAWTGTDEQGRHTACLLAALAPVCGDTHDPAECPADIMPQWLAHLTPDMDDNGSDVAWPGMVRRYADLSTRWHLLDSAAWQRAEYAVRAACVREAMRHTDDPGVFAVCERVAVLCEGVASGAPIDTDAFAVAAEAATAQWSAACAAAWSAPAAWAAEAAWSAAWSAPAAWAAEAAWSAAQWSAACAAARAAACAAARAARAARAVRAAAWDRLNTAILDAIESEIQRAEAGDE